MSLKRREPSSVGYWEQLGANGPLSARGSGSRIESCDTADGRWRRRGDLLCSRSKQALTGASP
eukprot:4846436-Prymnesium_polylepis.1